METGLLQDDFEDGVAVVETYTNPSTPSMRLNKPPLPPL
jgi:hypothetical protein